MSEDVSYGAIVLITYLSELTPPMAGLIRPYNLRTLTLRKLWFH